MIHQLAYNHMGRVSQSAVKRRMKNRNTNPFDLLYNETECYICYNFGHKATKCNLKENKTEPKMKYTAE